jgi:osmoprotectant transport system substrate-binding protein
VLSVVLLVGLTACITVGPPPPPGPASPRSGSSVVVASFNFPESEVLAQLYGQTLVAHGVPVQFELDLGARELVMPALIRGLVDVVPEYAGAALEFLDGGSGLAESDAEATYAHLQDHLADVRLTALAPSPAQDQNAFAVTKDTATRLGLKEISDLSAYADELVLGGPPECPDRPLCLLGLERIYGLGFREFVPLDSAGTVAAALADGAIDVGVLFSTDGTIRERRLVALRDDRALQPAENVVPVIRDAVLDGLDPSIRREIDRVSKAMTTVDLRLLNARMQFDGATAADVARDWLGEHDLAVPESTPEG